MNLKVQKKLKESDYTSKIIIYFAFAITIIITPWIHKESISVPKLILLTTLAGYLVPNTLNDIKAIIKYRFGRYIVSIQIIIIIGLILIVAVSSAPFEQQLFGRSGRLLGLFSYISLAIIFIASIRHSKIFQNQFMINIFAVSGLIVSIYSICQSFGIDFVKWDTRTNGVISTLGNPNFVSAFIAASTIPIIFLAPRKYIILASLTVIPFSIFSIYRTESIQGFIALLVGLTCYLFFYINKIHKKFTGLFGASVFFVFGWLISGALGHGVFREFLYKASVESRGDFWRSAFTTANHNPFFGVGLDSFGDYYLIYRDENAANHTFAEFTDSAHNYLLDYASQGGYIFLGLNLLIILIVITSFISKQKQTNFFEKEAVAIFSAWLALQATFIVSPISIPLMLWSTIFSGALISYSLGLNTTKDSQKSNTNFSYNIRDLIRIFSVSVVLIIMFPLHNTDSKFLESLRTGNGNLGLEVVEMYPRSNLRYFTIGKLFWESGQNEYALKIARSAVQFNDLSINAWGLIMINPLASYEERVFAKEKVLQLDRFNKEVLNYKITRVD